MKNIGFTLLTFILFACGAKAQSVLIHEDFQSGLPSSWTSISSSTGWQVSTAEEQSSETWTIPEGNNIDQFAITNDDDCKCNKFNEYLFTPVLSPTTDITYLWFDVLFFKNSYQATSERGYVLITTDMGGSFDTLAEINQNFTWNKQFIDLTDKLPSTDYQIVFHYSDGGGNLLGLAIDNVLIWHPVSKDIQGTRFSLPEYEMADSSFAVSSTWVNIGLDTIENIFFAVSLEDGTTLYSDTFTTNWLPFTTQSFTIDDLISIPEPKRANLKIWPYRINNQVPGWLTGFDTLQNATYIITSLEKKWPIAEIFVDYDCSECLEQILFIEDQLHHRGVNQESSGASAISYHLPDLSSQDNAYIPDANKRANFYQEQNTSVYIDGSETNLEFFTYASLKEVSLKPAFLEINTDYFETGSNIDAEVRITPRFTDTTGRYKLYVALAENTVQFGPDSFEHHFAARDFNSDTLGLTVNSLYADSELIYGFNFPINVSSPVVFGSGDYFTGIGNTSVIAFLQDTVTGEILQSSGTWWPLGAESIENTRRSIYPNPLQSGTTLYGLQKGYFELRNELGMILQKGSHKNLNTELPPGLYFLNQEGNTHKLYIIE